MSWILCQWLIFVRVVFPKITAIGTSSKLNNSTIKRSKFDFCWCQKSPRPSRTLPTVSWRVKKKSKGSSVIFQICLKPQKPSPNESRQNSDILTSQVWRRELLAMESTQSVNPQHQRQPPQPRPPGSLVWKGPRGSWSSMRLSRQSSGFHGNCPVEFLDVPGS